MISPPGGRQAVSTMPEAPHAKPPILNLPNALTLGRLALAVVLFALLALDWLAIGFVVFIIAASTDWLDGWVARRRGETTTLGRILDPFVDKVVVIGAFVFLMPIDDSGLTPWMVTLVVARELLVTGLRGYLEGENIAFGADWMGKVKMILQCVAIGAVLFDLGVAKGSPAYLLNAFTGFFVEWGERFKMLAIWVAIVVTALSGISYTWRAIQLVAQRSVK